MTYILILTLNILLVFFLRTETKYWLITITIWTLLIFSFIIWRQINDAKIDQIDRAYWESAESKSRGDDKIYEDLNEAKNYVQRNNMTFIHAIFLQSILTFSYQIVGFKRTSLKKTYTWTTVIFCILTTLILLLEFLLSSVPTGGIVT
jgi:ABC-type transport system involved in multi-copper enzyme maturation permease subunit